MPGSKSYRKDEIRPATVVRSRGSHVVAVVIGEEALRYLPDYGDTKPCHEEDRARRMAEKDAVTLAAMWNDYAGKAKLPERYEAREAMALFDEVDS